MPADTVAAIGGFLAGQGAPITLGAVFLATWIANVASAVGMYWVARTVGRDFALSSTGRRLLSPRAMSALEAAYARHHVWGIFVSRFLPGYRAVVPPFAGIAGLGPWRSLLPVAAASGLWYGFLIWLAHRLGSNWDAVAFAIRRVGWWLGVLAGAATAGLALLAWRFYRSRERA